MIVKPFFKTENRFTHKKTFRRLRVNILTGKGGNRIGYIRNHSEDDKSKGCQIIFSIKSDKHPLGFVWDGLGITASSYFKTIDDAKSYLVHNWGKFQNLDFYEEKVI